jgi:hypothetical protein
MLLRKQQTSSNTYKTPQVEHHPGRGMRTQIIKREEMEVEEEYPTTHARRKELLQVPVVCCTDETAGCTTTGWIPNASHRSIHRMKRKIRATKRCRWWRSGVTTPVKRWQTNAALDLEQSLFFVSLFFRSRAWEESPGSRNPGLDANPEIASGWNLEGTYCVLGRFPVGTSDGTGISFLIAAREDYFKILSEPSVLAKEPDLFYVVVCRY